MNKKDNLVLKNYKSEDVETGIFFPSMLPHIAAIDISIVSGDELAMITWKDSTKNPFEKNTITIIDSDVGGKRLLNYNDGIYNLYDGNLEDFDRVLAHWNERTDSYDGMYRVDGD